MLNNCEDFGVELDVKSNLFYVVGTVWFTYYSITLPELLLCEVGCVKLV